MTTPEYSPGLEGVIATETSVPTSMWTSSRFW